MRAIDSLSRLRLQGLQILLLGSWIWSGALGLLSLGLGLGDGAQVLLVSALVNVMPTIMVLRHRQDAVVRLMMSTLATVQPALGVFLLSGHRWQMDAHMFFFVALAGLAENVWKSRNRLPASLRERMWGLRAIAWESSQ